MKELDELDKQKSLYQLMTKLNEAETSIREKGTISADELEAELGVSDWNKLNIHKYVSHNYIFYRVEKDAVIIVEMFDEREDFMHKLFGGWYPHKKCIQAPLRATCPTAIAVYTRDVVRLSASELVSAAHIPLCTSLSYRADDRAQDIRWMSVMRGPERSGDIEPRFNVSIRMKKRPVRAMSFS